jgi:hypothetical protein
MTQLCHNIGSALVAGIPGQMPAFAVSLRAKGAYPNNFHWVEGPDGDGTLVVGEGAFAPVAQEVFEFEVSGLKVVQSWLNYRMRRPRNVRRSSPLDEIRPERWTAEFTGELLNVLWILEATIATYPAQRNLLERIIEEIQNDS